MIKTYDNQYLVDSLFAGGWRAEDKDELIAEYGFTEEEAEDVAAELAALEADAK